MKITFKLKNLVIIIHSSYNMYISQFSYYAWQEIFDNFAALVKFIVKMLK